MFDDTNCSSTGYYLEAARGRGKGAQPTCRPWWPALIFACGDGKVKPEGVEGREAERERGGRWVERGWSEGGGEIAGEKENEGTC